MSKIFVVTDSEAGWDNVRGVYKASSEKVVREYLDNERGKSTEDILIIHERHEKIIKLE